MGYRMTYEEFLQLKGWDGENRYECINHDVYKMPSPSDKHQVISERLTKLIGNFLEGKECRLFPQPFDVFLEDNVVIPDLCVVCDKSKIVKKGCIGAPDLIIEIISPSSSKRDLVLKKDLYLRSKVKEYWIVYPYEGYVFVHTLDENNEYKEEEYLETDTVYSKILVGLPLKLRFVFDEHITVKEFQDYVINDVWKLNLKLD